MTLGFTHDYIHFHQTLLMIFRGGDKHRCLKIYCWNFFASILTLNTCKEGTHPKVSAIRSKLKPSFRDFIRFENQNGGKSKEFQQQNLQYLGKKFNSFKFVFAKSKKFNQYFAWKVRIRLAPPLNVISEVWWKCIS